MRLWLRLCLLGALSCQLHASQRPPSLFAEGAGVVALLGPAVLMGWDGNHGLLLLEGAGGVLGAVTLMAHPKARDAEGRPVLTRTENTVKMIGGLTALAAIGVHFGYPFWAGYQGVQNGDVPRLNRSLGWGASVLTLAGAAWLHDRLRPRAMPLDHLGVWPMDGPGLVASVNF